MPRPKKKQAAEPKPKRHDPTPEERDERFTAPEGMTFEEAVRAVGKQRDEKDKDNA